MNQFNMAYDYRKPEMYGPLCNKIGYSSSQKKISEDFLCSCTCENVAQSPVACVTVIVLCRCDNTPAGEDMKIKVVSIVTELYYY